MLEFAKVQQNAKKLSGKLKCCFTSKLGCFAHFPGLTPDNNVLVDACMIGMVAKSLDNDNDDALIVYLQNARDDGSLLTMEEFEEFKTKAIIGSYLLKWTKYNTTVSTLINNSLIKLFREDLKIVALSELDKKLFNSCLDVFSQYCSFMHENQDNTYEGLMTQLGGAIQVEIHDARHSSTTSSSGTGWYTEVVSTLGIKI